MNNNHDHKILQVYRTYLEDGKTKPHHRLIGVLAIVNHKLYITEDHDNFLGEMFQSGSDWDLRAHDRLLRLTQSPYWRIVDTAHIKQGKHPDLLPEKL